MADAAHIHSSPERGGGPPEQGSGGGGVAGNVLIVAERNQGGKMVQSVLLTADPALRIKLVHARHGKAIRAEPVAMLFEAGKVRLHGRFPELEAELLGFIAGGGYEATSFGGRGAPGYSPDRADALVWALTELMLGQTAVPRIRGL